MSKRAPDVSVLTANRLKDGVVVYLAADGTWVEGIAAAAVARSADAAKALQAQGARDVAGNLVVEPYLSEVADGEGRPVPARMRERVRVEGPSILDDVPGYVTPGVRPCGSDPIAQRRFPQGVRPAGSDPDIPAGGERGPAPGEVS